MEGFKQLIKYFQVIGLILLKQKFKLIKEEYYQNELLRKSEYFNW